MDKYRIDNERTDTAVRVISVEPKKIYQALLEPKQLITWLPPKGMSGQVDFFEPWENGRFQITLFYLDSSDAISAKTSEGTDVSRGTFIELIRNQRIIQDLTFLSEDPIFEGTMRMTWYLDAVPKGTKVTVECTNVPEGINQEDHEKGLASTLENLAEMIEEK